MNKEQMIIEITKELQLYNKVSLHTLGNISDLIDKYTASQPLKIDPEQLWEEYSVDGIALFRAHFLRMFAEKGIGGQQWMSVKKELPSNFTTCIVWVPEMNEPVLAMILNEMWQDEMGHDLEFQPTHWQLLPSEPTINPKTK